MEKKKVVLIGGGTDLEHIQHKLKEQGLEIVVLDPEQAEKLKELTDVPSFKYEPLPVLKQCQVIQYDYPSGKQNRRERRKKERKNKK